MSDKEALHRYFGGYGGSYVAEAIWSPLQQLDRRFREELANGDYIEEFQYRLKHWVGRPTQLSYLEAFSDRFQSGRLWAKREDQCETGTFCSTLAIGYGLLAKRMGYNVLTGGTANGAFGVALGAVARLLNLDCKIFVGRTDYEALDTAIDRMKLLGVDIEVVASENRGRHTTVSECLRHWATHSDEVFYCANTLASPHPYPRIIQHFLSVIGYEAKGQMGKLELEPDFVVSPVGSGGFSAGMSIPFLDERAGLIGVEAAGEASSGRDSASILNGRPGTFQGTYSYVLQDEDGEIVQPASLAPGLAVAGVGPQHAQLHDADWVSYVSITDGEATAASEKMVESEGLVPSLETSHAIAYAAKLMTSFDQPRDILLGYSGSAGTDELSRLTDRAKE
jgi:tryptophan synthase beta chain